jgi:predicted ArsR family transcriptional regulator
MINRMAYLLRLRNVRRGLIMRSRILELLENEQWTATSAIAQNVSITSSTVLYHLKNMEREEIVERDVESRGWRVTPTKQVELTEYLSKKSRKK